MMPGAFLPSVEQTSLMRPFTERVIAGVLDRAAAWSAGPLDVPIAVNGAAADLLDVDFPATVAGLLRDAGIAPDRLCIEVTENAVMADTERTMGVLARLRDLGDRRSIDDVARVGLGGAPPRPRSAAHDRRLRHRPLVARAPQAPARRRAEDRQGLRLPHGPGRPRRRDRRGGRHPRPA